jgi:hypothetical protein
MALGGGQSYSARETGSPCRSGMQLRKVAALMAPAKQSIIAVMPVIGI